MRTHDDTEGRIRLSVEGAIATVTLDRPAKRNALTLAMLDDLEDALRAVDRDPTVRAVLVTAAGEHAFCAGADIHHFRALAPDDMWRVWTRRGHQAFDRLATVRQPTIAAIHGHAFGGGLELALACDLRVMAEDARAGLTEVGIGTVPGWGGTRRLTDAVGAARAKQAIFTGQPLDAATCAQWGLVNEVVPRDAVVRRALAIAEQVAAQSPTAVQMAKQAIDGAHGPAAMALEGLAGAASAGTEDFGEGVAAFAERRQPRFTGR